MAETLTSLHINAALNWNNGKAYFFDCWNHYRYDIAADKADPGYPQPIAGNWPELWPNGIDAAIVWDATSAYFFRGAEYLCYNIPNDSVDPGYPGRSPATGRAGPKRSPRASTRRSTGATAMSTFFRGSSYARYRKDPAHEGVEPDHPRAIAGSWPGLERLT